MHPDFLARLSTHKAEGHYLVDDVVISFSRRKVIAVAPVFCQGVGRLFYLQEVSGSFPLAKLSCSKVSSFLSDRT